MAENIDLVKTAVEGTAASIAGANKEAKIFAALTKSTVLSMTEITKGIDQMTQQERMSHFQKLKQLNDFLETWDKIFARLEANGEKLDKQTQQSFEKQRDGYIKLLNTQTKEIAEGAKSWGQLVDRMKDAAASARGFAGVMKEIWDFQAKGTAFLGAALTAAYATYNYDRKVNLAGMYASGRGADSLSGGDFFGGLRSASDASKIDDYMKNMINAGKSFEEAISGLKDWSTKMNVGAVNVKDYSLIQASIANEKKISEGTAAELIEFLGLKTKNKDPNQIVGMYDSLMRMNLKGELSNDKFVKSTIQVAEALIKLGGRTEDAAGIVKEWSGDIAKGKIDLGSVISLMQGVSGMGFGQRAGWGTAMVQHGIGTDRMKAAAGDPIAMGYIMSSMGGSGKETVELAKAYVNQMSGQKPNTSDSYLGYLQLTLQNMGVNVTQKDVLKRLAGKDGALQEGDTWSQSEKKLADMVKQNSTITTATSSMKQSLDRIVALSEVSGHKVFMTSGTSEFSSALFEKVGHAWGYLTSGISRHTQLSGETRRAKYGLAGEQMSFRIYIEPTEDLAVKATEGVTVQGKTAAINGTIPDK